MLDIDNQHTYAYSIHIGLGHVWPSQLEMWVQHAKVCHMWKNSWNCIDVVEYSIYTRINT